MQKITCVFYLQKICEYINDILIQQNNPRKSKRDNVDVEQRAATARRRAEQTEKKRLKKDEKTSDHFFSFFILF
jgi:hypothetical protein